LAVRVAISMGDPSGVGPEVAVQAISELRGRVVPYLFGDGPMLRRLARRARLDLPLLRPGEPLPAGGALVAVTALPASSARPGRPSRHGAAAQLAYLEAAYACLAGGRAQALCTAPVSKAQMARALPGFAGHTEWLAARTRATSPVMMLAGKRLRVALVTNHLPLARVARAVGPARIARTIAVVDRALRRDFGIPAPRIAVCALNPHAGDEGAIGDEERRRVAPALRRARRAGADARGPFPADSVFFRAAAGEFDAVVALYHDQGLIPVKLLDALLGETAVNVTLGLPIVRTSPDHGVAYDIAGKGEASARSMVAALELAVRMALRRRRVAAIRR
jgi:4-hydroxythreonine-4-phosphate dehydrogenase